MARSRRRRSSMTFSDGEIETYQKDLLEWFELLFITRF